MTALCFCVVTFPTGIASSVTAQDAVDAPPVSDAPDGHRNGESHCSPVYARSLIVSSSQPLSSQVGLDVLRSGGNAVDAAIAAAVALSVLEPMHGGPGGDVSVLYWDETTKQLFGLHSQGRPPAQKATTPTTATGATKGDATGTANSPNEETPEAPLPGDLGPTHWTTPGAVAGWVDLHDRFGSKPWDELFRPAIDLAQNGFPVSAATAHDWTLGAQRLSGEGGAAFLVDGQPPRPGQVIKNADLARTLEQLATGRRDIFYAGELGQLLTAFGLGLGGSLTSDDLAAHQSQWVEPINLDYHGSSVATLPTSTPGVIGLETLGILSAYNTTDLGRTSPELIHLLIESSRLATEDAVLRFQGDGPDIATSLSVPHTTERRRAINPNKVTARQTMPATASTSRGSTVIVCDAAGNFCLLTQDLGGLFGSGVIPGALGFAIQTRPPHQTAMSTTPVFIRNESRPTAALSVSAGPATAALVSQAVIGQIDFQLDAQTIVETTRVIDRNNEQSPADLEVEAGLANTTLESLTTRGHVIRPVSRKGTGEIQVVLRPGNDHALSAGRDPRHDSDAIGF